MLSLLHIENIAVIEEADIEFRPGFNALTGETGAGKSIVIDAIGAVIGERTSRELIRTGADAALVNAVFTDVTPGPWMEECGVSPDEDGALLISREIQKDGKNVCRINGRLTTVAQLRQVGRQLINIHGQHDSQQLLDEEYHIVYLDLFGEDGELLARYRAAYASLNQVRREISSLKMDESEKARRIDALSYQIDELERAELREGEEEQLAARRELMRNAGKLIDALESAYQALSGGEESEGAVALLSQAEEALHRVRGVGEDLEALSEKASEVRCAADDLTETVRDLRDGFDFSPEELDQVEDRLDLLHRLEKKYGADAGEMLAYLDRCKKELDDIRFSDDAVAALEKKETQCLEKARKLAQELSDRRREKAAALEKRIGAELAQLDMPKVRFCAEFAPQPEPELTENGMDKVRFLLSANVGEDLRPLQKVASGGELSRIMLALKNVLAEKDGIDTLIFDEVDTGVSGRAAQEVAKKMAQVSRDKQVLCVTHLPQIAAMAGTHFSVQKGERKGRTFTDVEMLDFDGRTSEVARLFGGGNLTQSMRQSAAEMLRDGEEFRKNAC